MADPQAIVEALCIAKQPVPFNAGVVADYAGCSLADAEVAIEWAVQIGIATTPASSFDPPEGRGSITVVGNRAVTLSHLRKSAKEKVQNDDGG